MLKYNFLRRNIGLKAETLNIPQNSMKNCIELQLHLAESFLLNCMIYLVKLFKNVGLQMASLNKINLCPIYS